MSTVSSTQSSIAAPPTLGLAPYATRQVRLLLSISSNAFRSLCFSISFHWLSIALQLPLSAFQLPFNRPGLSVSFNLNHLSMVFHFYCLLLSMSFTFNVSQLPFNAFHFHCIAMVLYFQRLSIALQCSSIALNSQCLSMLFNRPSISMLSNHPSIASQRPSLSLAFYFQLLSFHFLFIAFSHSRSVHCSCSLNTSASCLHRASHGCSSNHPTPSDHGRHVKCCLLVMSCKSCIILSTSCT